MVKPLTEKSDWFRPLEPIASNVNRADRIPFTDIFARFLKYDSNKTCLEIGCNPGYFLVHLHKHYGFKIFGIDYVNIEATRKNLENFGISDFSLQEIDFLNWHTDQSFDVVFSSGFIEHFDDYHELFRMHAQLVKPGGLLILTVPNLRYGQHAFHWLSDRHIFQTHNLAIMQPNILNSLCRENQLAVLFLSYYETIRFWIDNIADKPLWYKSIFKPLVFGVRVSNRLIGYLHHIPNRWFSPFLVLVARKPIERKNS